MLSMMILENWFPVELTSNFKSKYIKSFEFIQGKGSKKISEDSQERKVTYDQLIKKLDNNPDLIEKLSEKKIKEARAIMPKVQKILDKSVKTGLLKKNTASRKKSRISAMIKKAQ